MTTTTPTAPPQPTPAGNPKSASSAAAGALSNRWASAVALVIALLWTVPTAGLLISSFRPEGEVKSNGWWNVFTDPSFTLDNYRDVLSGGSSGLMTNLVNSIVISVPAVLIPISLATMAAYAFAWMDFKGRDTLFVAVFALQIVPIQVTLVPLLTLYVDPPFNLIPLAGTDAPGGGFYTIWLSHSIFALPLAIFLLHNFMREIPGELIESARVDGAGHVQIFTRVMLPLMMPAIAAFGIFQFLWVWNDLLVALVFSSPQAAPMTVKLVSLVGERGREVREFIENDLGPEGLARSVLVVATSDAPPVERLRSAFVATRIAESFRDAGRDVVLMMDSLTRVAMAQREIGLSAGEPPATRGYPPSVFNLMPRLLERAGTSPHGSITGLYTVLVEGDDLQDPIGDTARSILDGHVVLTRRLATAGHFPSIDVLESISRVTSAVTAPEQRGDAVALRRMLAAHRDVKELVEIGAYVAGTDPEADAAIARMPQIEAFLRQSMDEQTPTADTWAALHQLVAR